MNKAELILLGAGPGDPDLITVKAWRTLQQADIILYDRLANPALLDLAPPTCEKIFVGKQPYGPTITQEQIHELIREKAITSRKIVRLKGGDPFIFGRGFEEALFARELGMKVTYIPGISSMQTAGMVNIPLTHRAVSDGVWIITGTRKDGSLSNDLRLALRSKATVVIYMGMHQLAAIAQLYLQEGYGKMPAAIIRDGSLPDQQLAVGTAAQLPALAIRHQLTHPAIIIIGEVVSLSHPQNKSHRHSSVPNQSPQPLSPQKHRADSHKPPEHSDRSAEFGPTIAVTQVSSLPLVI
jgi:uroporphyrin-III C-methyltransferase